MFSFTKISSLFSSFFSFLPSLFLPSLFLISSLFISFLVGGTYTKVSQSYFFPSLIPTIWAWMTWTCLSELQKQSPYLLCHSSALPTWINSPCSLFRWWSKAQVYALLFLAAKLCSCAFLQWSFLPQHLCLPHFYHPADLRYHIH